MFPGTDKTSWVNLIPILLETTNFSFLQKVGFLGGLIGRSWDPNFPNGHLIGLKTPFWFSYVMLGKCILIH